MISAHQEATGTATLRSTIAAEHWGKADPVTAPESPEGPYISGSPDSSDHSPNYSPLRTAARGFAELQYYTVHCAVPYSGVPRLGLRLMAIKWLRDP